MYSLRQGRAFLNEKITDQTNVQNESSVYLAQKDERKRKEYGSGSGSALNRFNPIKYFKKMVEPFESGDAKVPDPVTASSSTSSSPEAFTGGTGSGTGTGKGEGAAAGAGIAAIQKLSDAFDSKMNAYSSAVSEYNKEILKGNNFFAVRVNTLTPINSCFNCDATLGGTDCSAMGVSNANGDIRTALPSSTSPTANLPPCVYSGVTVPGWSADPSLSGSCVAPLGQKCCNTYMLNGQPVCEVGFGADNYDEAAMNSWISACITPPSPDELKQRIALANEYCKGNGIDLNYWSKNANNFVLVTTEDPSVIPSSVVKTSYTYSLSSGGMWQGEAPNEYTCVDEPTRNSTGNNGDYNRYCIFDNEDDAKKFCNSDPTCKGYIANSANNMFSVTRKPVVDTTSNGNYFIKNTTPSVENIRPFAKMNSIPVWIVNTFNNQQDANKAKTAAVFSPTVQSTLKSTRDDMMNAGAALIKALSSQQATTDSERKQIEQQMRTVETKMSNLASQSHDLDITLTDAKKVVASKPKPKPKPKPAHDDGGSTGSTDTKAKETFVGSSLLAQETDTRMQFESNYTFYIVFFVIAVLLIFIMFSNFFYSSGSSGSSGENAGSSPYALGFGVVAMLIFIYFIIQFGLAYLNVSIPQLPFESINPLFVFKNN